jgi:eukaryotic-like serine/threonine-protein kinase
LPELDCNKSLKRRILWMDKKDNHKMGAKNSLGTSGPSDPITVKELFGLLLDAAEGTGGENNSSVQIKESVKYALEHASSKVRSAAEGLLEAHCRANSGLFCEPDSLAEQQRVLDEMSLAHVASPVIDGYTVGNEIGRGGFGVVYRGEQLIPVKRSVAIKILRTDLATTAMVSRFRAEASVLARMNHQGVARVIDAGLDHEKRPFVAMELIEGEPIDSYCAGQNLTTRQRVRLIEQVCDAVHHAHQRAVIHRDLKPANILVELQNDQVQPRVIDFGIAKLLEDGKVDTKTLDGHRLGTPRYMSPEQMEGDGAVDIRIDVYALGVLLCEVLTGQVPYKTSGANTRMSTRPSTLVVQADPARRSLFSELKGDLDRIVLKASANDPEMRYQSAAAMADDLHRYLTGLPVLATDPGLVYRGVKFLNRHKLASSLVAVAVVGLLVGSVGLSVGLSRATAGRDIAQAALVESEQQRQRAEFVNRFLLEDMLSVIDPNVNQGRDISVREVLDNASAKLSEREDIDIETQYTTLHLIGLVYSEIGAHDEAMSSFRRAGHLAEQFHGKPCREAIEIRMHLYDVIVSNGRSGMTKLGEQLNADAQEVLSSSDELYRRVRLRTTDSIEELAELIATIKADPSAEPEEHLKGLSSLANLYAFSFQYENELETRRQSYELSKTIYGPDHSSTFGRLGHYAAIRMVRNPDLETLDLLYQAYEPARRILGLEHPVTLSSMRTYANLLGKLEDIEAAIVLLEECEQGYRDRFGASSTAHTVTCSVLGEHYLQAGRVEEALVLLLQVRDDRARQWSKGHINNVMAHINVIKCYLRLGKGEEARVESLAAQEIVKPGSLLSVRVMLYQTNALVMLGLNPEARVQAGLALATFGTLKPSSSQYIQTGEAIAKVLDQLDQAEQAQELRNVLLEAQSTL